MRVTRAPALVSWAVGICILALGLVTPTRGHIIELLPGESDCLYQEFSVELLLPGESETTVPTEVSLGFEVKRQMFGRQMVQNAVRVNCTDPQGTVLLDTDGVKEEVRKLSLCVGCGCRRGVRDYSEQRKMHLILARATVRTQTRIQKGI